MVNFQPSLTDGAILFLETSEEAPSPAHVDAYLTTLRRGGIFDRVSGLILGRPTGYDDEAKKALFEVVAQQTAESGIPVLADVDLGHTDPMLTIPIGAQGRIDAGKSVFSIRSS